METRTFIMAILFVALGLVNVMLTGCGGGFKNWDGVDTGDDGGSSCTGFEDYYNWGTSDGSECYDGTQDVVADANAVCGDDQGCIDCAIGQYAAGWSTQGC